MPYTLQQLAEILNAEVRGSSQDICGIATLESAKSDQLSFFHSAKPRYLKQLAVCNAAAVLVTAEHANKVNTACLVVDDPYIAYAKATALFARRGQSDSGVDSNAVVAESASVSKRVSIAAHVVIGERCKIADDVIVGANTVIGDDCVIASGTILEANVTLYSDVQIGRDCLIHSGAVLGADGFGFAPTGNGWLKIHQLGGVRIGNNVEIGAGTTVDRGALDNTCIEDGVIIDNQVQIAHNVVVGKGTAIAGCTAVAGSTRIGEKCTIAGACGITGHLEIAPGSHVTAMTLVGKSIDKPGAYSSGTVAEPHRQWKRNVVRFRQLDELAQKVKNLETEFKQYKAKVSSDDDGC